MSNLTICRFTSNNLNYSLLVVPSFANGGNLFVIKSFYNSLTIKNRFVINDSATLEEKKSPL